MQRFVIIDGHHLMYRAFYAIPSTMKTPAGEQVNAVFGFASMLLQILRTETPDRLLFCFDADEDTFRHIEYAAYKEGRAETPQAFYDQIPRIYQLVQTFGFLSVSGMQYEADDFAGTYACLARDVGDSVTVISGDRDLLQLASDRIRIAVPHKGYQAPEYFGPAEVEKKYGVTPAQIPSYKALVGDPSDNLKGVKGIGPVAAASLLRTYGTLDSIYAHLSEIKQVWRTRLIAEKESGFFCKRMSELVCTIVPPVALDDLLIKPFPLDRLHALFTELQFTLVRKRLDVFLSLPIGKKYVSTQPDGFSSVRTNVYAQDDTIKEVTQLSLL